MVCAICGRMPLMMQSAPIRRAAATVFSRCWATSVSTVGTPVMSMIAITERVSTMACSRFCITTWVRALSRVPISGRANTLSHKRTTGVDNSSSSVCWRAMTSSRVFWYTSVVNRPSRSRMMVVFQISSARACPSPNSFRSCVNTGSLREKMNVAVCAGLKPALAREAEKVVRKSRTLGPLGLFEIGQIAALHTSAQGREKLPAVGCKLFLFGRAEPPACGASCLQRHPIFENRVLMSCQDFPAVAFA